VTPAYLLFYVLFSSESWRVAAGFAAAVLITPYLLPGDLSTTGRAMLYLMVGVIGYTLSGMPARRISAWCKKAILGSPKR
jgi:hypothetical protein